MFEDAFFTVDGAHQLLEQQINHLIGPGADARHLLLTSTSREFPPFHNQSGETSLNSLKKYNQMKITLNELTQNCKVARQKKSLQSNSNL